MIFLHFIAFFKKIYKNVLKKVFMEILSKKGGKNVIKGVQKRMIEVKLSGSKLYDSACFICKSGSAAARVSESEMIDEANKIISEIGVRSGKRRKRRGLAVFLSMLFCLLGALVGFGAGVFFF